MNDDKTVIIRVMPYVWAEGIYVLVPPKFWGNEKIAEGVKQVIEHAFLVKTEAEVSIDS